MASSKKTTGHENRIVIAHSGFTRQKPASLEKSSPWRLAAVEIRAVHQNHKIRQISTTAPSFLWLLVFVLLPTILVVAIAFRTTDPAGGIGAGWSLKQFAIFKDPSIHILLWRTLWISIVTTALCILLGLPIAWFIARLPERIRPTVLLLVIIPFWTNFLIRVFAWNQILHSEGIIARCLRTLRLLGENDSLLYNPGAVVVVSLYTYLPFAILPLYAAAEKFDFTLIDAARDLGASGMRSFVSVFLPSIRKGLNAALAIVFIPMLGAYVIPDLVGGTDGQMIGNKIAQRNFSDRNLPSASAMSAVLTLAVLVPLLMKRREKEEAT